MSPRKKIKYAFTAIFLSVLLGCTNQNSELSRELTLTEKEHIKLEIKNTLEGYAEHAQSKNLEQILSF